MGSTGQFSYVRKLLIAAVVLLAGSGIALFVIYQNQPKPAKIRWSSKIENEKNIQELYLRTAGGVICAGNFSITAIDAGGTILNQFRLLTGEFGYFCRDNRGVVYAGSDDGCVYAIDPNGEMNWSSKLPEVEFGKTAGKWRHISVSMSNEGNLLALASDGVLCEFSIDGELLAETVLEGNPYYLIQMAHSEFRFVAVRRSDKHQCDLVCFDFNGYIQWEYPLQQDKVIRTVDLLDDILLVNTYQGEVIALTTDGSLQWEYKSPYLYSSGGSLYKQQLFISPEGEIHVISGKSILQLDHQGKIVSELKGDLVFSSLLDGIDGINFTTEWESSQGMNFYFKLRRNNNQYADYFLNLDEYTYLVALHENGTTDRQALPGGFYLRAGPGVGGELYGYTSGDYDLTTKTTTYKVYCIEP